MRNEQYLHKVVTMYFNMYKVFIMHDLSWISHKQFGKILAHNSEICVASHSIIQVLEIHCLQKIHIVCESFEQTT